MDQKIFHKVTGIAFTTMFVILVAFVLVVAVKHSRGSDVDKRLEVTESVADDILSAYTFAYIESTHVNADHQLDDLIRRIHKRIATMCHTTAQPALLQRCDNKIGKPLREIINRLITLRKHGRLLNKGDSK